MMVYIDNRSHKLPRKRPHYTHPSRAKWVDKRVNDNSNGYYLGAAKPYRGEQCGHHCVSHMERRAEESRLLEELMRGYYG